MCSYCTDHLSKRLFLFKYLHEYDQVSLISLFEVNDKILDKIHIYDLHVYSYINNLIIVHAYSYLYKSVLKEVGSSGLVKYLTIGYVEFR